MLAGVVPQQCLLVFASKGAVGRGTSVGPAVRKDLVNLFLEVLHDEVVLLLAVLVLGLWLESAKLASVGRPEAVGVLGQDVADDVLKVQHFDPTPVSWLIFAILQILNLF